MKSNPQTRNTHTKKAWDAYYEMEKLYARNWSKVADADNDQLNKFALKAERIGIRKCMKILKDTFKLKD